MLCWRKSKTSKRTQTQQSHKIKVFLSASTMEASCGTGPPRSHKILGRLSILLKENSPFLGRVSQVPLSSLKKRHKPALQHRQGLNQLNQHIPLPRGPAGTQHLCAVRAGNN